MKIDLQDFRLEPGANVDLTAHPTGIAPLYSSKSDYKEMLADHVER
jgi:hypothetical protein